MAKDFTAKDVNKLIKEHERIINELDKVIMIPDISLGKANAAADELIRENVFSDIVNKEIQSEQSVSLSAVGIVPLVQLLYCSKESRCVLPDCKLLLNRNKDHIKSLIKTVSVCQNGIKWFFTSGKNKELASKAYHELEQILKEGYSESASHLIEAMHNTETVSPDVCLHDFEVNKEQYLNLVSNYMAGKSKVGPYVQAISALIGSARFIENNFNQNEGKLNYAKVDVKNKADRLLAEEVIKVLKKTSIDELNRDKSGFRLKALKNAGFNTVADIYYATTTRLESINGVSWTSASLLKQRAEAYAGDIKSSVKVKLNADNKTVASQGLIAALYSYRRKERAARSIDKLRADHGERLTKAITGLEKIGNGFSWIFNSDDGKAKAKQQFRYLQSLTSGAVAYDLNNAKRILDSNGFAATSKELWDDFNQNSIEYYSLLEEIVPGVLGNDDARYGLPEDLAREIQDECIFPDGLLCTLRRYQEWGVKYALHQERVLLGDEMGLGKTVQAIATMVSLKNTGAKHFMVVCPASVVTNWCREIVKHSKLRVVKVHGSGRQSAVKDWIKFGGVAVTTYETTGMLILPDNFKVDMIVVDEAHYIKNSDARRTINVKALCGRSNRLLFMTGTALENNVDEMVALIAILRPDIARQISGMKFLSTAGEFRKKIAPVYYRRKREDVLTELPELIESKEWCTLLPEEELVYENAVLNKRYADARRVSWSVDDLKNSSKAKRLMEIVSAAESDGRKVIVFSFFLDTIHKIYKALGRRSMIPLSGSVTPQKRQEIIDEFSKAPAGTVLPAQIQSGGTGLNIQAASVVVICEPQFKPSIENQAISRAYRMGQTRNVLVYRLLCENTVDEKIMDLLEEKQRIFNAFADKSVAAQQNLELDDKTFGDIIKQEIDRINAKKGNPSASGASSHKGNQSAASNDKDNKIKNENTGISVGTIVYHKKYGNGVVESVSGDMIEIRLSDHSLIKCDYRYCLNNELLIPLN